ncbi:glutathione S-transferase D7-like [Anopheles bellator]|uniref:glutathione S-transferase D7-like n=1 Tax=Anopheles bellator TaxID=139047 RepID=UPI0026470304|nr:glutathione S-transferase D7-like [Anopheles bellator]
MAPLVLYHFPGSPPSRSALLVLRNLDLDVEVKIINLFAGEHMAEEYVAINPEHTVPTLVDETFVLWESKAIATYLTEQYKPGCYLYPNDPKTRALINHRLYFDSGTLFPALRQILASVLRSGITVVPQEMKETLHKALEKMESYLDGSEWMAGAECTLADLCALANVATIKHLGVSFDEFPNIDGWYERCQELPGTEENDEGAAFITNAVKSKLEEPY